MSGGAGEERTIAPTPRRLAAARRRGRFAHSRDLTSAAAGCAVVVSLWMLGPGLWSSLVALIANVWSGPAASIDDVWRDGRFASPGFRIASFSAGILGIPLAVAVVVSLLQQGFRVQLRWPPASSSLVHPSIGWRRGWGRVSPIVAGLVVLKVAAVCVISGLAVSRGLPAFGGDAEAGGADLAGAIGRGIVGFAVVLSGALMLIGVADWMHCRRRFRRELRMTAAEARDEARESKNQSSSRTEAAPRVSVASVRASHSSGVGEASGWRPGCSASR